MAKRVRIPMLLLGAAILVVPCWLATAAQATYATPRATGHTAGAAQRPSSSFLRGVTINGGGTRAQVDREITEAKELHAQAVRIDVSWAALQPSAGQLAPAALAALDNVVRTAVGNGVKVIMLVQSTPCWASSAPPRIERACVPGGSSDADAWAPQRPADFGAFVAGLTQRYRGALAAIEVWNEPDYSGEQYLAGPNKAQNYAAILKAAYTAIKSVDASLPVLGGAIVGPNGGFLDALYANGIKGYYDGLAVHFYTLTIASLRAIHEVQLQNGDTTPLWLDEFGWSSCWPRQKTQAEQGCVTQRVQATNLVNMTRALARTPYVAAEVFYKLRDSSGEDFGVGREHGGHKRSFAAVAHVFASPFGDPAGVTLKLRRSGRTVLASGSAAVGDYMELEVLHQGVPRYRTIFVLDRFNRFSITLPAAVGTRRLLVRVWQYGKGVSSAAQRRI
jgi:hypothetical protein